MYTLTEAKQFVDEVISNVWQNGLIDRIPEIYTEDVIGHFQEKEFYLVHIKARMKSLNDHALARQFVVQDLVVINDLIIFRMRQIWLSPVDGGLCESILVGIYRIRDKKICELWIMSDQEMDSYNETSENLTENVDRFQVTKREKASFLQQMTDYLNFKKVDSTKLSSVEMECLYYYLNGYTAKEVSKAMGISHRTVESYISNIKQKYHCSTRRELRLALFPNAGNLD